MKNIVIVSSSMRKGNSDTLCDEFQKGAEKENKVIRINLREIDLHFCNACCDCYTLGKCRINDKMNTYYDAIKNANILVFASPIYFGEISGQLKTFIDRLYPIYQTMNVKQIIIIASCFNNDKTFINNSIGSIKRFATDIGNIPITNIIYGEGCDDVNDISKEQKQIAFDLGLSIK